MLILGAADTGKSTLIKNLRIIHDQKFSEEEMFNFRLRIRAMTLEDLSNALTMPDFIDREATTKEWQTDTETYVRKVQASKSSDNFSWCCESRLFELAIRLWSEPIVQEMMAEKSSIYFTQETTYFLTSLESILSNDYRPSHEDILTIRIPTTGKSACRCLI